MTCIKIEALKIANLLKDSDNESSNESSNDNESDNEICNKKMWYIINDQNNGQYGKENENDSTIKFETKVIKPFLCDYSDPYILVTGNIAATCI